jgi:hypothetical protein
MTEEGGETGLNKMAQIRQQGRHRARMVTPFLTREHKIVQERGGK